MKINEVLIKPIITEKATDLTKRQVFTFQVHLKANKNQIKNALETLYKVKVGQIKVVVRKGKVRKVGKKMTPKTLTDRKIAYIYLKDGRLDLFPQA
ncbi:50S ribosomal protein L23 [Candidatus Roizmanbacteria bacterium RIFCSPHIGHO2_01_FULL_39_8]|uniref:Large ribosomal subunit protein uL23 n=3 Tax=Candidatus Roizmaniibacteriota TaxID=1752723 RepID=A0A1F7GNE3_9BACT|nr:MAG: 50S ribosomal protein L23 [Candidatus Roizmanbacteria bacterium RIFCSPHIGHO2_01_FULL_39_8]OGK28158.1 MAG: 50S ribosomal protein L23 [Candidatus Roizmanbacteria bacterium RIFCSPHIGHO2_02_FULL_39_9]OGK37563.1 MAG: 50S ribosomal protein L23 [Candidatus Roizmanbacteria bacterium RIFCSPHIGHO2_12_FULL_39_8]